jgi:hypothetical protein
MNVDEVGGGRMSDRDVTNGTVIELLLREPEIAAWLEPLDDEEPPDDDYEPPRAA